PATLVWVEALDGGDPKKKAAQRDKVVRLAAPFQGDPAELVRTEQRFMGISWGERGDTALLSDFDRNKRRRRTFAFNPQDAGKAPRLLWDRSINDRYRNPGLPVTRTLPTGGEVMHMDGNSIFLTGPGSSPKGDRPFLDRFDLTTQKAE